MDKTGIDIGFFFAEPPGSLADAKTAWDKDQTPPNARRYILRLIATYALGDLDRAPLFKELKAVLDVTLSKLPGGVGDIIKKLQEAAPYMPAGVAMEIAKAMAAADLKVEEVNVIHVSADGVAQVTSIEPKDRTDDGIGKPQGNA